MRRRGKVRWNDSNASAEFMLKRLESRAPGTRDSSRRCVGMAEKVEIIRGPLRDSRLSELKVAIIGGAFLRQTPEFIATPGAAPYPFPTRLYRVGFNRVLLNVVNGFAQLVCITHKRVKIVRLPKFAATAQ